MQAPASDGASVARLEVAVTAQEGVRAVKRLQNSFSHYLEWGLGSDLSDLFSEAAIAESSVVTARGKKDIARHFMQAAAREGEGLARGQLNTHLILQPIVTVGADGKSAKGTWHEFALLGQRSASASWRGGIYENEYAIEDGVWKITHLRYFEQYGGAYEEWGHKAPAKWRIPYHFEAKHAGVTIPAAALQPSANAKPADAKSLAARIQRLRDETALQNLQNAFGYYLDRKLWEDVADLFARSGVYEIGGRGAYTGAAEIRQALEAFYGASPLKTGELFDHIIVAPVVTIAPDGKRAWARSSELTMIGLVGQQARWELGTHENEFVKEGGVWKFGAVRYFPRMSADYDEGWAKDEDAVLRDEIAAFHFAHPVTGRKAHYPAGASVIGERGEAHVVPVIAELSGNIATLERALHDEIGVDATENLMSSYGYYIDESAWDDMADTYASTGSKEITGVGVYVGPERIRTILNLRGPRGGRNASFFTIHQLTQPVIHVAPDGKSARARLRLFQCGGNADGSSGSWIGGVYENTAVFENGEWKFGVQDLHHLFNASYRNGWARVGLQPGSTLAGRPAGPRDVIGGGITQGLGGAKMGGFAAGFPPDHAIRAKQYAFPHITEPAFHYVNPVSGRRPNESID